MLLNVSRYQFAILHKIPINKIVIIFHTVLPVYYKMEHDISYITIPNYNVIVNRCMNTNSDYTNYNIFKYNTKLD